MTEKRPREYIAEILALRKLEDRRNALADVPDKYRNWVKHSVINHFEKLKFKES